MHLSELLHPKLVRCCLAAKTKDEAVRELVGTLIRTERLDCEKEILEAIAERERHGAFSMGKGVVFPHARAERVARFFVVMGTSAEGIDFGAADGVPVRLIVLFVMPKGPSALYLQALAGFSALVGNTYHLQHLCGCVTPEEVISYVEATGIRIREQLALKDVMLPTIHTITPEHSIKEAVVCLCQLHLESLPIVDSEGALLGEITGTQLVKMGLAGYLSLLGNASVLNSPDLFENFLRLHGDGKVGTLMSKRPLTIPIEASLFEAGLRLVNSNATQAFVVKGKTLAGILKMDDFVKRLILGKGL